MNKFYYLFLEPSVLEAKVLEKLEKSGTSFGEIVSLFYNVQTDSVTILILDSTDKPLTLEVISKNFESYGLTLLSSDSKKEFEIMFVNHSSKHFQKIHPELSEVEIELFKLFTLANAEKLIKESGLHINYDEEPEKLCKEILSDRNRKTKSRIVGVNMDIFKKALQIKFKGKFNVDYIKNADYSDNQASFSISIEGIKLAISIEEKDFEEFGIKIKNIKDIEKLVDIIENNEDLLTSGLTDEDFKNSKELQEISNILGLDELIESQQNKHFGEDLDPSSIDLSLN